MKKEILKLIGFIFAYSFMIVLLEKFNAPVYISVAIGFYLALLVSKFLLNEWY